MPGERGRPGPSGTTVRAKINKSDSIVLITLIRAFEYNKIHLFIYFVFQGMRGAQGNVGKPGPMVRNFNKQKDNM